MRQKKIITKTVCLEHQIYASKKNIAQPLVVMVETFRMSDHTLGSYSHKSQNPSSRINFMHGKLMKNFNNWDELKEHCLLKKKIVS